MDGDMMDNSINSKSESRNPNREGESLKIQDLVEDLKSLGIRSGDMLFVHSSLKSIGPVDGGAATVIAALEKSIAPDGLLLMPSFNLVDKDKRASTWNIESTPSTVGYLTEFFRTMPGTLRSDHYSHSVAARGKNASEFVSGHLSKEGLLVPWDREPWGRTFGTRSPYIKAYENGGKLLMLGVDYHSSTYVHLVETLLWNEHLVANPKAEYIFLYREKLGEYWDSAGKINRGHVGNAECRLFSIKDFVDTLLELVRSEPKKWTKWG